MKMVSHQIPKKNENISYSKIKNEILIFNIKNEHYYSLNETGGRIFELCDNRNTIIVISKTISKEFGVEESTSHIDTVCLLMDLCQEGIITI